MLPCSQIIQFSDNIRLTVEKYGGNSGNSSITYFGRFDPRTERYLIVS